MILEWVNLIYFVVQKRIHPDNKSSTKKASDSKTCLNNTPAKTISKFNVTTKKSSSNTKLFWKTNS